MISVAIVGFGALALAVVVCALVHPKGATRQAPPHPPWYW